VGSMQQAVLEFDEAVLAPWRPRLCPEEVVERPRLRALPPPTPSRASVSRAPRPAPAGPARQTSPARGRVAPGRRPASGRPVRARVRPGCRPVAAPAGLRLTARGKLLVAVLALAAGTALAAVGAAVDRDAGLLLAGESSVVVRPGDTVWDIAVAVGGDGDVRAVVDEIERLNGLDGAALVPGQLLRLP
jgi:nucleoid-associated protein YgaU